MLFRNLLSANKAASMLCVGFITLILLLAFAGTIQADEPEEFHPFATASIDSGINLRGDFGFEWKGYGFAFAAELGAWGEADPKEDGEMDFWVSGSARWMLCDIPNGSHPATVGYLWSEGGWSTQEPWQANRERYEWITGAGLLVGGGVVDVGLGGGVLDGLGAVLFRIEIKGKKNDFSAGASGHMWIMNPHHSVTGVATLWFAHTMDMVTFKLLGGYSAGQEEDGAPAWRDGSDELWFGRFVIEIRG